MVPAKFIDENLKENSHYYAAHLTIARAEREYDNVQAKPYFALKSRRNSTNISSRDLMHRFGLRGYNFDGLKQEIEAAQNRQEKEDGRFDLNVVILCQSAVLSYTQCSQNFFGTQG